MSTKSKKLPKGIALLHNEQLNKGTAFTEEERRTLGLEGLLPTGVNTMGNQVRRFRRELEHYHEPLAKYIELAELHDRNEQLFYRLLL